MIVFNKKTVLENIKKNKRLIIITFISFLTVGILAGTISSIHYSKKIEKYSAEKVPYVNLESINKDEKYYYNAILEIDSLYYYLQTYVLYFDTVNMNVENKEKIDSLGDEISQNKDIAKLKKTFYENPLIAFGNKAAAIKFYNDLIDEVKEEKNSYENQLEILRSGNYSSEYKDTKQLKWSISVKNLEKKINDLEKVVKKSQSMDSQYLANIAADMDSTLQIESQKLNLIVKHFNKTMAEIAESEQYEIIYNKHLSYENYKINLTSEMEEAELLSDKKDNAVIYAKSVEGLDIGKERFYAYVTFFLLCGVVISTLVGMFYKKENAGNNEEK